MKVFKKTISLVLSIILSLSVAFVGVVSNAAGDIDITDYSFPIGISGSNITVSSPYGQRDSGFHAGIDFAIPTGTPILSWKSGKVERILNEGSTSWGNYVIVKHGNYKGQPIYSAYAHLSKILVKKGDTVKQGENIALSGNTGVSTGPHLHFEIYLRNTDSRKPPATLNPSRVNPAGYIGLKNKKGYQTISNISLVNFDPTMPNVLLTVNSNSKVTLSYSARNASKSLIYRKIDNGDWKLYKTVSSSSGTLAFSKLEIGKKYSFKVKAQDGGKNSPDSEVVSFTPLGKVKGVDISLSNDNKALSLSWNAVPGASEYIVYRKTTGSYKKYKTVTKTSYTNSSLKSGKTFKYKIKAKHKKAIGAASDVVSGTTLYTPKITSLKAVNNTTVKLTFKKQKLVTKFYVYRRAEDEADYTKIGTTSIDNRTFTDTVGTGKRYFYRIKSTNGSIVTGYSAVKGFRSLGELSGTKCVLTSNTSARITFSKVNGATKYLVYRKRLDKNGNGKFVYFKSVKTPLVNDNSLQPGYTYWYEIYPSKNGTKGACAATVKAQPLVQPTISNLELIAANKVKLTWGAVPGADKYKVYVSTNAKDYKETTSATNSLEYNINKTSTYYFKVEALKEETSIKKIIASGCSAVSSICGLGSIGKIFVKGQFSDTVTLTWDSVAGAKEYKLYRNSSLYKTLKSNELEFVDKQVSKGVTYSYYVVAVSGKVSSEKSNVVNCVSIAKGSFASAYFSSINKIELSWNTLNGVDGYQVQQRVNGEGWKDCYTGKATRYTISNVDIGNEYSFRVRGYSSLSGKAIYGDYSVVKTAEWSSSATIPSCSFTLTAYDSCVVGNISTVNDVFTYECEYSTNKNSGFKTAYSGSSTSFTLNNLKNGTTYYFRVKIIMTVNDQRYAGGFSPVKSITPREHYTGDFEEMVNLATMFGSAAIYSDSAKYWYDYSDLYAKDSSFIEKYKNAMIETGAKCSVSANKKKYTFDVDGNQYYLEIINDGTIVSVYI